DCAVLDRVGQVPDRGDDRHAECGRGDVRARSDIVAQVWESLTETGVDDAAEGLRCFGMITPALRENSVGLIKDEGGWVFTVDAVDKRSHGDVGAWQRRVHKLRSDLKHAGFPAPLQRRLDDAPGRMLPGRLCMRCSDPER